MKDLQSIDYLNIKTLTKAILISVGIGTVLVAALFAPNALQILRPYLGCGKRTNHERERVRQALHALMRRRLVEYIERGGKSYLRVTQRGKKYTREYQLESLVLSKRRWDSEWRIILFDIPERYGTGRRALQKRLKSLGCYQFQKSVFIYPHECEDEIDFVSSFYPVRTPPTPVGGNYGN